MNVKVCDAICGAGKTSACINMMNNRTDCKYIFVTQFLSEVDRIKIGCSSRNFVSPDTDGHTKLSSFESLVAEGKNIATTHALFLSYTDKTKELIRKNKYTLVLDEVVDMIGLSTISNEDIQILRESGTIADGENGLIEWKRDSYIDDEEGRFRPEMLRAKSQNLLQYKDDYYFWIIPPDLFTCFENVYVLTYLFEAQSLRNYFDIYHINYELIGTKFSNDVYQFCPMEEMNRAKDLRGLIHVINSGKVNDIGKGRGALSMSWYNRAIAEEEEPDITRLRSNLCNVFKNIFHAKKNSFVWTTFKTFRAELEGRGYGTEFLTFNKRASNEYAHKKHLAYCLNVFPRPFEARFFHDNGSIVYGDMYALSTLVQWVFRSAVRNGEEVWLYLPSERMRWLFNTWLDNLAEGRDLEIIHYKTPRKKYNRKKA